MERRYFIRLCSLLTILLLLSLSQITLALPSPPTHLTSPVNLTNPPSLGVNNCVKKHRWFQKSPDFYDCARAIYQLPDYEGQSIFHNGPPNDPDRLPKERTDRTCRVRVELVHEGGSTQDGSWVDIRSRAADLDWECLQTPLGIVYAGGWTTLGRYDRIIVVLEYSGETDAVGIGNGG